MSKVTLIRNRSCFVVLLVGISFLLSCTQIIQDKDVIFLSGKYCAKSTSKPFSGKSIHRFSSGEVEGETIFKNGLVVSMEAFGYEGELIGGSTYEQVHGSRIVNGANIERITFVSSHEGVEYQYFGIQAIVKETTETSNYELLQTQVMQEMERLGYLKKVNGRKLTFEILRGELESPLYEIKIN